MTPTAATRINLAKRSLLHLPESARSVICESGTLWITQDGDRRDTVLEPGQQFRRDRPTGAIAYALQDACLSLQHAPQAAPSPRSRTMLPAQLSASR